MKRSLLDLAILGGPPAFPEPLHVGRPNIGDRQRFFRRVNDALDRRYLTNKGPYVCQLEERLAELLGVKHCIAMCNGTIALEIAIRALDMQGEVIVPSLTFVATAHALQWQGIRPVFCDIDPATHNLDPRRVEEAVTPRTRGVIGVHLWGRPCEVEALEAIAREQDLALLYDAAHAFGCSHAGRMIGNFGDAEVFSFHATKFFNTLEGGAIATNDDALAKKIHLMKNFGFADYDQVIHIGTNGKMNEISAAMGLTLLEDLDKLVAANHRNYTHYRRELEGLPGVKMVVYDESEFCNYQYVVLEIEAEAARLDRDTLVKLLWAENVLARRYFTPGCHRMEPYCSSDPGAGRRLPVTEWMTGRLLSLPTGTAVRPDEIGEVCAILRLAIAHAGELRQRLDQPEPQLSR